MRTRLNLHFKTKNEDGVLSGESFLVPKMTEVCCIEQKDSALLCRFPATDLEFESRVAKGLLVGYKWVQRVDLISQEEIESEQNFVLIHRQLHSFFQIEPEIQEAVLREAELLLKSKLLPRQSIDSLDSVLFLISKSFQTPAEMRDRVSRLLEEAYADH